MKTRSVPAGRWAGCRGWWVRGWQGRSTTCDLDLAGGCNPERTTRADRCSTTRDMLDLPHVYSHPHHTLPHSDMAGPQQRRLIKRGKQLWDPCNTQHYLWWKTYFHPCIQKGWNTKLIQSIKYLNKYRLLAKYWFCLLTINLTLHIFLFSKVVFSDKIC